MKFSKEKEKLKKIGLLIMTLIVVSTLFLGIGYAQLTKELTVTGRAIARVADELFISDVVYDSDHNANTQNSTINSYSHTMMNSTIELGNTLDSTITYNITLYNNTSDNLLYVDTTYNNNFYDNPDIEFDLVGLDNTTTIGVRQSHTFSITFRYANNLSTITNSVLNSYLKFNFTANNIASYWDTGPNIYSRIQTLSGNRGRVTQVKLATAQQYNDVQANLTSDNEISINNGSPYIPSYMWYDTNTKIIYYYTTGNKIYLNANCENLFRGLTAATSIETTLLDSTNTTSFSSMFWDDKIISTIDVSNFNTASATTMYGMFYNCNNMTSLNVSNFVTSEVTNMASMFGNLYILESLDLGNFNTEKVKNMQNMFNTDKNLTYLNVSSFKTPLVTNFSRMFASLEKIETLDISNMTCPKATTMEKMFSNDYLLTTIYVSPSLDVSRVGNTNSMFINDNNLVGGNGTPYDGSIVNGTYAVIDAPGTPGYFTAKS